MAPEKKSYRPGHRRNDLGRQRDGIMSESRWAWLRVVIGQFVILVDEDEAGRNIRIFHPLPGGKPVNFNLTSLTEEELLKLKELFNSAFDWALPEVRQRDKEAADAFAEGDDSHARVYRQAPQLVYRKRPEREYSEGIQQRSARLPERTGRPEPSDGGLRGPSSDVAQPDPQGDGPEDDEPAVDQSPEL